MKNTLFTLLVLLTFACNKSVENKSIVKEEDVSNCENKI